jgi:AAA family ATP:ADP antiporter
MSPTMGLTNTVASPDRLIGWFWYLFVESFGSLIVALFWIIATDITLPESAKRGFPIIALFGQIGNIFGPFILSVKRLGLTNSAPIVLICGILMIVVMAIMWYFMNYTPKSLLVGYHEAEAKMDEPGFLEGLKILFSNGYMLGIFFIVSVYEIIVTVMDNHFKNTAFDVHEGGGEGAVSGFLSDYAVLVGLIATASILLGINNIQRILGIRASLILLPLLIGTAMVSIALFPSSLQLAYWIMALSKAINYALNQPTLKQLYIPTNKETRYKTQGWIEMFGSRSAKASASVVNLARNANNLTPFLYMVAFSTLGLVGIWILIAVYVSNKFNDAIEKNEVVC